MTMKFRDKQAQIDRLALLRATLMKDQAVTLAENPQLAAALLAQVDQYVDGLEAQDRSQRGAQDGGLSQLIGLGAGASEEFDEAEVPADVSPYDDTVTSERISALADLYYIYQHERIGVFDAILRLRELYRAGTVRLDTGQGAYLLYKFDRKQVLRYTLRDRTQTYRRVFGYSKASPPPGSRPNLEFHNLLVNFVTQVVQFYRDKRVSEVIRQQAGSRNFGSIAIVRRSGLDLRNNLKNAAYGHVSVLRVEVLQLLDEAFRILSAPDVKKLFGADNAWDVIEEILRRYAGRQQIHASQRNRLAIAGRDILRWLAQPHILESTRVQFEALLEEIGEPTEEWITSAQALGGISTANRPRARIVPRRPAIAKRQRPSIKQFDAFESSDWNEEFA